MQNYSKITIFFAGDFCSKPSTAPIKVSEELKGLIQSCDFKVVNFEVPLKPENVHLPHQKQERFFQHDDAPAFLKDLGFNLFQLANNHAFDWGDEGFKKTKAVLGDAAFGAGTYEESYKIKVVEKNGVKIGFLALSFAAYKGVFDDVLNREGLGCAYINDLKVNHIIIEAKKSVDFLFVLPHDGIEYIDIPMPETMARYRDFIDYGADGVVGTHPHCPQGWEVYKGKPIFYSLGNFLFNSKVGYDYRAWNRPHWYEGWCVLMTLLDGKMSWEVVNTRNVDNLGIEIDTSEKRAEHNELIVSYIMDKKKYLECLQTVCKDLGNKEMYIIDRTFHSKSFKQSTKTLWNSWWNVLRKRPQNDYPLKRLLTHDARRSLLMWTMKLKSKY
ncbi:MAG: CapA family protein [Prevotella sp.]|nr:CapA family protein [Prevotella sp.]